MASGYSLEALVKLALSKQDGSDILTSLAGLASAPDKLPYFSAVNVMSMTDFTALARTLLAGANAAAMRTTLGLGTAAVKNIGTAAGQVPDMSSFITQLSDATPVHGTSGRTVLPGGIIFQWGMGIEAVSINFPYPFPTACMAIFATSGLNPNSGIGSYQPNSPTVATVNSNTSFGMSFGSLNGNTLYWFAIGI